MVRGEIEEYIADKPNVSLTYPFGDEVAVYVVNEVMFALLDRKKRPLNLSLRCDHNLGIKLRRDYESVMPGHNLHPKQWITVINSGQLGKRQILDLVDLAYNLALKKGDTNSAKNR